MKSHLLKVVITCNLPFSLVIKCCDILWAGVASISDNVLRGAGRVPREHGGAGGGARGRGGGGRAPARGAAAGGAGRARTLPGARDAIQPRLRLLVYAAGNYDYLL